MAGLAISNTEKINTRFLGHYPPACSLDTPVPGAEKNPAAAVASVMCFALHAKARAVHNVYCVINRFRLGVKITTLRPSGQFDVRSLVSTVSSTERPGQIRHCGSDDALAKNNHKRQLWSVHFFFLKISRRRRTYGHCRVVGATRVVEKQKNNYHSPGRRTLPLGVSI